MSEQSKASVRRAVAVSVAVSVVALTAIACVSTKNVARGQNPDPRAALPPVLTAAEKVAAAKEAAKAQKLRTVLQLSEKNPIIDVRVVFEAGSADDPAGKEGLTALAARLMREATVDKDTSALSEALFPMAAEIDVQVDKDAVVVFGRCHKDHKDAFLKLFTDVLAHPRLDPADFARLKADATSSLQSTLRTGNDEALQREALEAGLYDAANVLGLASAASLARHPYRHTPSGTVAGLAAITLDDVKAQLRAVFTRDRVVLGVGGGADAAFVDALSEALQALPATGAARAAVTTPVAAGHAKLLIVEKPSAGSAISLGFVLPELSRTHPDYPAMKLAETWFGEHRNLIGHLFNSMRETRGLNYGDYAYVEHFVQDGWSTLEQLNTPRRSQYFSMWIRPVQHANRLFALRMAHWELQRFVAAGIPDDAELERVRSFVMGYWTSKEQDPMRRLGYAIDEVLTGMPFDRPGLRDRVARLSRKDINAAIARHLHADNVFSVVVTQDAAGLKADIVANTPSPITYDAKKEQGVLDEDKVIGALNLGLGAGDVVIVPPTALFQQ